MFKFKDCEGQRKYKEILEKESHLQKCFENDDNINTQVEAWLRELLKILAQCFEKVRVTNKTQVTDVTKLMKEKSNLKQQLVGVTSRE